MVSRRAVFGSVAAGIAAGVGAAGWKIYEVVGSPSAVVGFTLAEDELQRAVRFLEEHLAIDTHAHPGRTFVRDAENLTWKMRIYALRGTFESRTIAAMRAGHVATACFCAVPDFPTLDTRGAGLRSVRGFVPGEAYASYRTQIENLRALITRDEVALVLSPADVQTCGANGKIGAILGVEGADFLGDDLGRVERAFADGVRVLTLVHYFRGGVIGDVMTSEPVHGGLTRFGRDAVQEMNRVGIIVDVSHCSQQTAYDALDVATKPLLITHAEIQEGDRRNARFVSADLAGAVAEAGGVVGAWPAGIALRTLDEYVGRILDLVDLVGEDHVCVGTDMDANYKPVFENYAKMPLLVGGLLRQGMPEEALAKLVGGNFLRVFAEALTP
jgi:membrane dipeptidase